MKDWQEAIYKVYTEAKQFEAGKYHPRFGKTAQEFRSQGASVPSRDAMIFISNLLEYVGIFTEDETDSVVKNFNAAERRLRFLELLEIHSEEIKSSAADIDEQYAPQFERFFKVESSNRGQGGRGEKYSANAAAIEIAKQQKEEIQKLKSMASGGAADALNVLSSGLDEAENEMFGSLKASFEDPTTMFEIKLENPGFADKVVNFLKPFAGDSEIEVYGDTVEFSADPDSQIAKLVAKVGREKVEDTINNWLDDNTTGGVAVIIPPDEPGSAEQLVAPRSRRAVMDEPEATDEEPEYGSKLPDAPEMDDDTEDYSPRYSSRPSFAGDDEDFGGDSDYTPIWAREDEEHEGARRDPREEYDLEGRDPRELGSEFYDDDPVCDECGGKGGKDYPFQGEMEWDTCRHCGGKGTSKLSKYPEDEEYNKKSDLNKDGRISGYEQARGRAISRAMKKDENNEEYKMSPQQINQWMYMQRASRMQNNLRQNERWGNY